MCSWFHLFFPYIYAHFFEMPFLSVIVIKSSNEISRVGRILGFQTLGLFRDEAPLTRRDVIDALIRTSGPHKQDRGLRFQVGRFSLSIHSRICIFVSTGTPFFLKSLIRTSAVVRLNGTYRDVFRSRNGIKRPSSYCLIHFYKRPDDVTPKNVTKYIAKMFLWILSGVGVKKII